MVKRPRNGTYNVEHDVIPQARGAVYAHQDAIFNSGAEAHGQTVRPRARSFIVGPCVCDETPTLAKDIGGASCRKTEQRLLDMLQQNHFRDYRFININHLYRA